MKLFNEENCKKLFEKNKNLALIIIQIDKEKQEALIKYLSAGAEKLLAYKKTELLGKNIQHILSDSQANLIKDILDQPLKNDLILNNVELIKKNNEKIKTEIELYPFNLDVKNKNKISFALNVLSLEQFNEKLQSILNNVENAIWSASWPDYETYYISPSIQNIYGYEAEEFEDNFKLWYDCVHPEDKAKVKETYNDLYENGFSRKEMRIIKKNGEVIWVEDQNKLIYDGENNPIRIEGIVKDITERKKSEAKLKFQLKFQELISDISANFVKLDPHQFDEAVDYALEKVGKFFEIDRSYLFLTSEDGSKSSNTHEWCRDGIEPKIDQLQNLDNDAFPWFRDNLVENNYVYIADLNQLSEAAANEKRSLKAQNIKSLVAVAIFDKNDLRGFLGFESVKKKRAFSKEVVYLLEVLGDLISAAYSKYLNFKEINYLNIHDKLTGLYNRKAFIKEMKKIDQPKNLPLAIIMTDINGLKLINNSYGQNIGDQIIIKSAELLNSTLKKSDIIGRWGGDEFIILMPNTHKKEVELYTREIKNLINIEPQSKIDISLSAGSALKISANEDIFELVQQAEQALFTDQLTKEKSSKNKIVKSLLSTLRNKSDETENHSIRMAELAQDLGRKVGVGNDELNKLALLANIHDIGKIAIPESILNKPGKPSEEEWKILKTHPIKGAEIAAETDEFAPVAEEILSHHEHWDGSGYPRGLKAKEIPLLARILSIVDAYDVMINERPYKKAMTKEEAVLELKSCAGSQFDPELVEKFLQIIGFEVLVKSN
ncbi:diguanylate cyclase [Halanaerobium sp. Z-7514]|uniref:Diguanylate cyclase n=1 Tax=Halanaerobium polyolivorans TaxID=2886943 RepID=A0AAW4X1G9_9FIRM|nr:HD domain-containing phosphohydrolase [Halanaerobium polyolivorans]MCC3145613.1 diguanylate cyclase [Halanaerobium polyolivorans]